MNELIIDQLNIYMPDNWAGDDVYLARSIAKQLQKQAHRLISGEKITLTLEGEFSGLVPRINQKLSAEINKLHSEDTQE